MDSSFKPKYRVITVSGKIAVGTTTLTKNLRDILKWKYINAGAIQREWDRKHGINENKRGAYARSDKHEKSIEAMTKDIISKESNIIYEAWLSGFVAQKIKGILKVLIVCSNFDIKVDRVVNRDRLSIEEARKWIKQREEENIKKWQKLYGKYDFWSPEYYDLVIDTYSSGPMETVGIVLDRIGYKK